MYGVVLLLLFVMRMIYIYVYMCRFISVEHTITTKGKKKSQINRFIHKNLLRICSFLCHCLFISSFLLCLNTLALLSLHSHKKGGKSSGKGRKYPRNIYRYLGGDLIHQNYVWNFFLCFFSYFRCCNMNHRNPLWRIVKST